jgi:hypothetical protein
MGMTQNETRLRDLEKQKLLSKDELFAVTKRGKNDWRIQPGDQMDGFVNNDFEYKHIGPNTVETVQAFHAGQMGLEPKPTAPPIDVPKKKGSK